MVRRTLFSGQAASALAGVVVWLGGRLRVVPLPVSGGANDGGACGRRILAEGVVLLGFVFPPKLLRRKLWLLGLPDRAMVALNVTLPLGASSLSLPWLG